MVGFPIKEYSLSANSFNEPEVFSGGEGVLLLLTRLMLLEPGLFDTHPDMGVGLITFFRYRVDEHGLDSELQTRINQQINTYLPFLSGIDVRVKIASKSFYVGISINGTIYRFLYDTVTNALETDFTTISDL